MNKKLTLLIGIIALVIGITAGYFIGKSRATCDLTAGGGDTSGSKNAFLEESLSPSFKKAIKAAYQLNSFKFTTNISGPIGPGMAKILIDAFQTENQTSTFPMMTASSLPVHGFFIDRKSLDLILKNTKNVGVSFYLAKDSAAYKNNINHIYTLVYMGAQYNASFDVSKPVGPGNYPYPYINANTEGDPYDYINPCPDACGDFHQ